uniref:CRAL-TRIO domain-containing protein n=2 Tax=Corethron hystrix TaxID=216773 RepID=A0A7S1FTJ5_9STRA|mmetsp:Transcript_30687/g.70234  ORF Transcript_30687/g.70234 Transcript_30687/m.70234 type:complete len:289 (+) Transcript_30687:53-919(+)
MSTPPEGVERTERDLYGQRHPVETDEIVSRKLKEFEEEVKNIPDEEKSCLLQAQERCPQLLTDGFKLMFLRSEVFHIDLATKRYVRYWEKRVDVFGPEKAFLPLTVDGALRDDHFTLTKGFMNMTGKCDPSGRSILFGDPSKMDPGAYEAKSMCRALWYILHSLLENEETQKKGVVFLLWPHNFKPWQLDKKLLKMNSESVRACIPLRVSALHVCHPPKIFAIVFPILKMFMGEVLRKRFRLHSGNTEEVLKNLEKWGLTRDIVASPIGGDVEIDMHGWIAKRRAAGK